MIGFKSWSSVLVLVGALGLTSLAGADSPLLPIAVRGWSELLLPIRPATPEEQTQVNAARDAFVTRPDREDVSAWTTYLAQNPESPFRLAILTNLGRSYFQSGRFSLCLSAYQEAWQIGKSHRGTPLEALAGHAVGELAMMDARLGRYEELEALFAEVGDRPFQGPGSNLLGNAQAGYELMKASPETSFRCGPMALSRILTARGETTAFPEAIRASVSTRQGISMVKVKELAGQVGLGNLKAAKRAPGAAVIVPSVVHWKVGHYGALVKEENGRYLLEDPTFAVQVPIWLSKATLDSEASGYFLADLTNAPSGWSAISDVEAAQVWGKGETAGGDPTATGPSEKTANGDGEEPCGMAQWDIHLMLCSLNLRDRPIGYTPPVGPPMMITATYNSRENDTVASFSHSNFGHKWNLSALAYIVDNGTSAVVNGGYGGSESYIEDPDKPNFFARNKKSYSMLHRTSLTPHFVRTWPDGTQEEYAYAGPTGFAYRTKLTDPSGNAMTYHYSSSGLTVLLTKITDSLGQETLFEYGIGGLTPTKITDPFGRFATFEYNNDGQLTKITDMIGIASQFAYKAQSDFIHAMTTPYGTTQFEAGSVTTNRWLQVTHPNGDLERAEFKHNGEDVPANIGVGPEGMLVGNNYHNFRNSFYWDRKAMKEGAGDVSKARLTHFLHMNDNIYVTSGLVESEKAPLESGRTFYNYEGQTDPIIASLDSRVSKIGRILDDGTTQLTQVEHNEAGKPTRMIDPDGRVTLMSYAANLNDILEVRVETAPPSGGNPATTALLASYSYDANGHPMTFTDAAGHVTTFAYNGKGQVVSVTMPNGEITSFTYNASGYLTGVNGPLAGTGDSASFTYDAKGRIATLTDAAGMTITTEYDNLDRITKKTYPDGGYEQWTYEALRPKTHRTKGGRLFTYQYNALAQLVEIADQLNRKTVLDWCKCGQVKTIIDPTGKMTKFFHDVQGRLTGKQYADGSTSQIQFSPVAGRISKVIDEDGREQNFTYTKSARLAGISYSGTGTATPAVTMTWDPIYARPTGYTDGTGTTNIAYHPTAPGQLGAGMIAAIDGPLANDVIDFNYDAQGRVISHAINGVTESYTFDGLGRTSNVMNALGAFGYSFEQASTRVTSVTLPNGSTLDMAYFNNNGLKMLKDLTHKKTGGATVSKFSYTYDSELRVTGMDRVIDGSATQADTAGYDGASRLTSYQKSLTGGGTKNYAYGYDEANNRVSETVDGAATSSTVNLLNQLTHQTPPPAANRNYEWDQAGRLIAFVQGAHRSEFSYDGLSRRVRIVEKENNIVVADRRFVWVGLQIAQERSASNTVVKHFFSQGFKTAAGNFFYTRDHLGSIREVVDNTGTVRARYDYDPFGRRTKLSGDMDSDFGFTSAFSHEPSQLCLTYARAYDPNLGRWISRDPLGESGGGNLYAYVGNNPMRYVDLLGLDISPYTPDKLGMGGQVGDMAINLGKIIISATAFSGAAVLMIPAVLAVPLLGPLGLVEVSAVGSAVSWTGYALLHSSKNLTLNIMGYQNDQDGNPIKDFWKVCGDPNSPMVRAKKAVRDITALGGDLAMGQMVGFFAGNTAAKLPGAAQALADVAGDITGFMDMMPTIGSAIDAGMSIFK